MSLDRSAIGTLTGVHEFPYDWKAPVLYALGIGAKRDELDYLYEGRGPKVYPTFAVVPAFAAVAECLQRTRGDLSMVVHGGQSVIAHAPLPPSGTLLTTGAIKGIYDMKKMAQVVIHTDSHLQNGPRVFSTEWSLIVRGAGGFGGEPPPKPTEQAAVPKDRPSDFLIEESTSPEQALLYRLSGDLNPLHADPAFANTVGFVKGPILHGLATYGFTARALTRGLLGGNATRLCQFSAQFRRPVWPGDTLITRGWRLDTGKVALQTSVKKDPPEVVLSNAWATVKE